MNKTFFAVIAALPFVAGCWPFSKKEAVKQEAIEAVTTEEEVSTPSEESASEDDTQGEPESDEK